MSRGTQFIYISFLVCVCVVFCNEFSIMHKSLSPQCSLSLMSAIPLLPHYNRRMLIPSPHSSSECQVGQPLKRSGYN